MSNVFDKFALSNRDIEVEGLGSVTIKPMSLKEFMGIADQFDTEDKSKMLDLQFKVVSQCLVKPKMTVKQLEALGQEALAPITNIFLAIQGDEAGKN